MMKYIHKFYEYLIAWGEAVYQYRKHNKTNHYY
jgi:hypothetical protein